MKASVVILNWNGEKFLKQFLPSVLMHTNREKYDIVVADNGSTDNSLQTLKEFFPEVKTILFDKNYGFAEGYNKALEQIDSEYFVILNSDIEVSYAWLDTLTNYMDAHLEIAACQPKIRAYHAKSYFEHAGAAGGYIDKYGFPFCRGRVFGHTEEDFGQYDEVVDIFWATGACLMIRSEVFKKVGGFDADFFAHMEEIDLCWRINSRGYRIVCVPQSVVYHVGGGTLNVEHPYKTYLNFRNNLLLLYKNLPQALLDKTLRIRTFFDYLAAFQLFITGKPKNAKAVFKARKDFKLMQVQFEEKRRENILFSTCSACKSVYRKSIVFEYYLKGKKTYQKLR